MSQNQEARNLYFQQVADFGHDSAHYELDARSNELDKLFRAALAQSQLAAAIPRSGHSRKSTKPPQLPPGGLHFRRTHHMKNAQEA
jgi:hypothetical protein